jgi:hypothetical protein
VTTCVKCCQSGKPVRDSVPRVFTGGWSHRQLLPVMHPNSRFWEGKQVFSINHIVYANSLNTMSHCYQLMVVETLLKSKFPDTSQGLPLSAGLSKCNSQTCYAVSTLFCSVSYVSLENSHLHKTLGSVKTVIK